MDIAILLYNGFTALDAVGPSEVLSRLPGARVRFVAFQPGEIRTDNRMLALIADAGLDDVPHPEIVVVPGGPGEADLVHEDEITAWLQRCHQTSTWTASVCTGSLLLGRAGLLDGLRATSHWLALDQLREYGAIPSTDRVVAEPERRIITAAGVSSGIDMALTLAALVAGETVARRIQLGLEYDPQPPFDSGSPAKAGPEDVEALRRRSRFRAVTAG